jgi:hypothetical protein
MALGHGPTVVTQGLVLALDAADRNSYPGSGTTWTDLSGNGYVGTLYNDTTYNSANGGGLVFDGVDDFVDINSTNIITGTNPFSIDCWFTLSSGSYGELFGNYGSGYTSGYVWFATAGLYINGSCYVPSYATATQGTHYLASTRNSSGNCVTYFDGVQVATATLTASIPDGPNFRIGADTKSTAPNTSGLSEELNGRIYQLKVYNRALSAAEISQNFNALRGRFGI